DGGGLRGHNSDDELVFIIDDAGDVVFSGVVTGAEIIGSRMTIGDIATTYGRIEQAGDAVHSMVQAEAGPRAQLRAMPTRAEVASYANAAVQHAPVAGFTAQIGNAGWTASSDQTDPSAPIASGVATADSAYMLVRAERDTPSSSRLSLLAQDGLAIL